MSEAVPISQWAERWWHIVRSHRPSQLGWRAVKLVQRRLFPLLPKPQYTDVAGGLLHLRDNSGFDAILRRQLELRSQQGNLEQRIACLLRGEFQFLNETRNLGPHAEISLSAVEPVSRLWLFHWHYQEYLLDLLAAVQANTHPEATNRIPRILDTWMQSNPVDRAGALGDAWHPFCLSRRIPVWLLVWHAGLIPDDLQERFTSCLEAQIRFLERHLEWDLRGNHLLENLKALALAGAFCGGKTSDRRLRIAQRHLEPQLDEQLLPSGEHFERSPMYHAQMLAAVLDVRDAVAGVMPSLADVCGHAAERMATFLESVIHPDGQIPLLADSVLGETPSPRTLIASARDTQRNIAAPPAGVGDGVTSDDRPQAKSVVEQLGDYWTWTDKADFLVFDAGPVGADELPAHAHGDLLTIEASVAGGRLIVDSGVYDYEESDMRRYCRSTAAHNALQVDATEQCDLWSRFRMGRRGRPTALVSGADREFSWAGATHDAYRRWGVPVVGRWIACRRGGPWIIVDWAEGEGRQALTHWLHLAPEAVVEQVSSHDVSLVLGDWSGTLRYLSEGTVALDSAWYCPDFGVRREAPVLRFEQTTLLPGYVVWMLCWEESTGRVSFQPGPSSEPKVVWEDGATRLSWSPERLIRQARPPQDR